jgi:hypothetical protein
MSGATTFAGAADFVRRCSAQKMKAVVVSHKTQFAMLDGTPVDLRESARAWMTSQRFFDLTDCGLSPEDVFFESTRVEKIERIRALGCTHFIDDLAEVFAERSFPSGVAKLLFAPHGTNAAGADIQCFRSWRELDDFFFHDNGR